MVSFKHQLILELVEQVDLLANVKMLGFQSVIETMDLEVEHLNERICQPADEIDHFSVLNSWPENFEAHSQCRISEQPFIVARAGIEHPN